jgi:hypothetical protein
MWGWVKATFGLYRPDELPNISAEELSALEALNIPLPLPPPSDAKIISDLMHKGLVRFAVRRTGYALTGLGMSVLAANAKARS